MKTNSLLILLCGLLMLLLSLTVFYCDLAFACALAHEHESWSKIKRSFSLFPPNRCIVDMISWTQMLLYCNENFSPATLYFDERKNKQHTVSNPNLLLNHNVRYFYEQLSHPNLYGPVLSY